MKSQLNFSRDKRQFSHSYNKYFWAYTNRITRETNVEILHFKCAYMELLTEDLAQSVTDFFSAFVNEVQDQ